MLCDICHQNIATVHLTEIIDDRAQEMHLCEQCAKNKTAELKEKVNIADLLGGLLGTGFKRDRSPVCPRCGLRWVEFKKKGRLGCGECYITFRKELNLLLKKVHGSVDYLGKVPFSKQKVTSRHKVKKLKGELARAVAREEYEEAARIRDEIKKIEALNPKSEIRNKKDIDKL